MVRGAARLDDVYSAMPVACRWPGTVTERVTRGLRRGQLGKNQEWRENKRGFAKLTENFMNTLMSLDDFKQL